VNAIELYRSLLRSAHGFLEGTLADVTPAQFTWDPPGKAFSIGANYTHVLGAEDIAKECRRLKDAGVEFVEDPKDFGNVWVATFKDPEGNLLQLLQFHR